MMWKDRPSTIDDSEIEETEIVAVQKTPRKFLQQKVPSCGLLDILIATPNLSGKHINKQAVVPTYVSSFYFSITQESGGIFSMTYLF